MCPIMKHFVGMVDCQNGLGDSSGVLLLDVLGKILVTYIGNILEIYWKSIGKYCKHIGNMLNMHWECTGKRVGNNIGSMEIDCTNIGNTLETYWTHIGNMIICSG